MGSRRYLGDVSTLEERTVPAANLQIIHNSPYPAAATVDVYVNDAKFLDNLSYKQSTAFLSVPDSANLKIDIVSGAAANNTAPIFTQTVNLAANSNTIAAAVGDPGQSTGSTKFGLAINPAARQTPVNPANAEFTVLHGTPDAAPIDVKIRGIGTVVNDVAFKSFANDYISVPPGKYIVDVTLADGVTRVGSFNVDLSAGAGTAHVFAATGFIGPAAGSTNAFGLLGISKAGLGTMFTTARAFAETSYGVGGDNTATLFTEAGATLFTVTPFAKGITSRTAVGDVNGDGTVDLIVGAGPGGGSVVSIYDGKTQGVIRTFSAFESAFTGGVFVAAADLNGDGFADYAVTPDQSGGGRVQIRSGRDGSQFIGDFFGIDDTAFRGGARASFGDVNGDAVPDLVVAAGFGGGPRVAVFNGLSLLPGGAPGRLMSDFFAFETALRNGAYVAAGDVDGDGFAEVIGGGGPGGGPRVTAFSGKTLIQSNGQTLTQVANFFAGDSANRDGVRLAVKDLDGDYRTDIVVGLGAAGSPQVRTFLGKSLPTSGSATADQDFNPYMTPPIGGVFVG